MEGAISIPRNITEASWANNPVTMYVFIRLVLKANWKDGVWMGTPVKRGELITSVASLSRELGIKVSQTNYTLKCLRSDKRIICESTSRFTKIIICDYDSYQFSQKTDYKTNYQTEVQTDYQTECKPSSNNRIKEEKDKRIEKKTSNDVKESELREIAARLYELYPASTIRKDGGKSSLRCRKQNVEKIVSLLRSKTYTEEYMENAIKQYVSETNPEYLKMFSTFLNSVPDYSSGTLINPPKENEQHLPAAAPEKPQPPTIHISTITRFYPKEPKETPEDYRERIKMIVACKKRDGYTVIYDNKK